MPPPSDNSSFHLRALPGLFFVVKLEPDEDIRSVLSMLGRFDKDTSQFISVTRTKDEVSIVGESGPNIPEAWIQYATWRAIKIVGPMDFGITGVLTNFTLPLKLAQVPVFALSTWNTDYVLVPETMLLGAVGALKQDGWTFVE